MVTETITITASFGNEMQRDVAMKVLRQILAAWECETEEHHQEKRIGIVYARDEAKSISHDRTGSRPRTDRN